MSDTEKCPTDDKRVGVVLSGIKRTLGAAPVRKAPIMPELAISMVANSASLREIRNRAIVLIGLASAMRRSEIVALNREDLEFRDGGVIINIRHSKTDAFSEGQQIGVVNGSVACPVMALKHWLEVANITSGPIFPRILSCRAQRVTTQRLAARNIASIVKAGVEKLGLNPADYAGHSLRRGHVSAAVRRGVNVAVIATQTRHADLNMIIAYTKLEALLSAENSSAGLL